MSNLHLGFSYEKLSSMQLLERLRAEDYIHVIDNFYPSLEWLAQHVQTQPFFPVGDVNYSGLNSCLPANVHETRKSLEQILGKSFHFYPHDGVIRVQRKMDENKEKTFIHTDEHRLNVIIYLSDPPKGEDPEQFGTHFYRHKNLKRKRLVHTGNEKEELQRDIIYEDNRNFAAWDVWLRIPYKKNRCLIFDGNLYHSAGQCFFGTTVEDSRMTQNFFPDYTK